MTMTALTAARTAYLDAVTAYTNDKTTQNRDAAIAAGKAYTDAIIAAGGDPANDALLEDDFFTNPTVMTPARRQKVKTAFGLTFPMVWRFETTAPNQPVVFNCSAGGNVNINWGDGLIETGQTGASLSHSYANPGTYDVEISGTVAGFTTGPNADQTLKAVVSFGDPSSVQLLSVANMFNRRYAAFAVPAEFTIPAGTSAAAMFYYAPSFNGDISGWDVSGATSMESMFQNAHGFNQDISGWDVSNVTNMHEMFYNNNGFNQDISGWDVSSVTDSSRFREFGALTAQNSPF